MADATADSRSIIDAMTDAFLNGDNARAEALLMDALDQGVPWDAVTTAAAQAVSRQRQAQQQGQLQRPRPLTAPA